MRLGRRSEALPTPGGRLGGILLSVGALMEIGLALCARDYSNGQPAAVIVPSIVALLLGVYCLVCGDRTPARVLAVMPTFAAELVCLSMWKTGTPLDGSELLFVWCVFFAGYFLPSAVALATTVTIAGSYAWVVVAVKGAAIGSPPAVEMAATLIVACLLLTQLRSRVNARLDEAIAEARTDPLTGLLNRRGLGEMSVREVERADRDGRPLAVWMVDLDHFKSLNDAYGHAAGDRALELVADTLRAELRGVDVIARVGGEEFCVLLPNCTVADAFLRAESVRQAVAAEFERRSMPVTVSIGVAGWRSGDADGTFALQAADEALYVAKAAGRNRTQVAHGVRHGPRTAIAELS